MLFENFTIEDLEIDFSKIKGEKAITKTIEKKLKEKVDALMVEKLPDLLTGHDKQPREPLVRIRVEYEDEKHAILPGHFL